MTKEDERGDWRGGEESDGEMEGQSRKGTEEEKEDVLQDYRLLSKQNEVVVICGGRGGAGLFFYACPCQVDVEE